MTVKAVVQRKTKASGTEGCREFRLTEPKWKTFFFFSFAQPQKLLFWKGTHPSGKLLCTDLNLSTCQRGVVKKKKTTRTQNKNIYIVIDYCSKPHTDACLQYICTCPDTLSHTYTHTYTKWKYRNGACVPTSSGGYKTVGWMFSTSRSFGNGDAIGAGGRLIQVQGSCGGCRAPQAAFRVCVPAAPPLSRLSS